MRKSSVGLVAVLSLLAVPALTACGSASEDDEGPGVATSGTGREDGGSADGGFTIGYVPPTVAPFERALRAGIELQAEQLGMEVVVAGGQFDAKVQLSAAESLIDRGVDALLIWPNDTQGIQPAFDRARERDIPIVTIDSPDANPTANFQTNDADATAALAEYAASQIGEPCRVGVIMGLPVVPILRARNEGYVEGAEAAGCEILDEQVNTTDTPERASAIVQAWKTRFGDELGGVLAYNDPTALAAAALTDGGFEPVITGVNGDTANIEAIEEGRIAATAVLPSPELGNGLAFAAHQLLTGRRVPATVAVEYVQLTEENVGDYVPYEGRLEAPMRVSLDGGTLEAGIG